MRLVARSKRAPSLPVDYDEPRRAWRRLAPPWGLKFAVVTSVNRDDRKDGGAELFALTIQAIRQRLPQCAELRCWCPIFKGSHAAMDLVLEAAPDILNHQHRDRTQTLPPGALRRPV